MVRLRVVGSGSDGNCYILEGGAWALVIECGMPVGRISKALGHRWERVAGCVVSHRHSDHLDPRTAREMRRRGVEIYGMDGILDGMGRIAEEGIVRMMPSRVRFGIGGWGVRLFPVPHGECPNAAMLITSPDGEHLLFATDLSRLPYAFRGVNYLMVECNYSEDIRMERTMDNEVIRSQSRNHMEMGETLRTVSAHMGPELRHVVLLHPSRDLLDTRAARMEVSGLLRNAGVSAPVAVACAGLSVEMSMYPF